MAEPDFAAHPLIPAIAQDARDGRVLMLAWVNQEAFRTTRETGFAHYFSRSRNRLWKKGEESGHVQKIVDIFVDCDADAILYLVEQTGPACHTGRDTCFFRRSGGADGLNPAFGPRQPE
ncbi:MAG: Phosphoribosyl-AMP cyclohydrolase [Myxococcota bacterium]|nr:Phosphoribosyl-AMP cyclohydrolase [Myxococcota bacterium]